MNPLALIVLGMLVGVGAAFTGLGGGFLVVPFLIILGYSPSKAVGTSFVVILLISLSALLAHKSLLHVDFKVGVLLGVGGIIGAQIGARLVEKIPDEAFKILFVAILFILALKLLLS
jgi:hypothetical protein